MISVLARGVTLLGLLLALGPPSTAGAAPDRAPEGPPQTSWPAAWAYSIEHPDALPPGLNDFSRRPTAAHPRPVLLVNGTFENSYANWAMYSPKLKADGYCVFGLNYGGPETGPFHQTGDMRVSAQQVGDYVDTVLAATGADRVDIVGHSQGGLVPLYFINRLGGQSTVGTMVGVAAATHGISAYGMLNLLAMNPQAKDLVGQVIPAVDDGTAGSAFVTETGVGGMTRPEVDYATVSSRSDLVVQLSESQLPPGPNVSNIVVQDFCAEDQTNHGTMVYDDVTLRVVRNILDPATAVAPACHAVAPLP
ncbi:esterase/lipase family protein [Rhodococcus jostii]|uniref:Lipase (Class 2) n=1 Tax=Rhodococcus jostii TaxID=132919 RepID=A0A1H4XZP4_RHOJO|nr:alpha/beta fold hydrolase [Rhodococcus jostii]SED11119.1 Lipase (class 2) [Rhodococcus jostii]